MPVRQEPLHLVMSKCQENFTLVLSHIQTLALPIVTEKLKIRKAGGVLQMYALKEQTPKCQCIWVPVALPSQQS